MSAVNAPIQSVLECQATNKAEQINFTDFSRKIGCHINVLTYRKNARIINVRSNIDHIVKIW